MRAFGIGIKYGEDWDESNVANALREAVSGFNIDPDPDRELSVEKHYFIKGQNFVKDAVLCLADELDAIAKEREDQ